MKKHITEQENNFRKTLTVRIEKTYNKKELIYKNWRVTKWKL